MKIYAAPPLRSSQLHSQQLTDCSLPESGIANHAAETQHRRHHGGRPRMEGSPLLRQ